MFVYVRVCARVGVCGYICVCVCVCVWCAMYVCTRDTLDKVFKRLVEYKDEEKKIAMKRNKIEYIC